MSFDRIKLLADLNKEPQSVSRDFIHKWITELEVIDKPIEQWLFKVLTHYGFDELASKVFDGAYG